MKPRLRMAPLTAVDVAINIRLRIEAEAIARDVKLHNQQIFAARRDANLMWRAQTYRSSPYVTVDARGYGPPRRIRLHIAPSVRRGLGQLTPDITCCA